MGEAADRVARAFAAVSRADFLPPRQRSLAAQDRALVIGYGQTNSQPTTVRTMLELLDPHPGERVLDVGSGSGWTTVLLGSLVGESGRVYGVELEPDLVAFGRSNAATYAMGWISFEEAGRGPTLGLPDHAPYDKILVSAEAQRLPIELVQQVRPGGRMVIPVAGRLAVVDCRPDGTVSERRVGHYAFVPLRRPAGS